MTCPTIYFNILFSFLIKAQADFTCTEEGKFLDSLDKNRYHQCSPLYGRLTHIHQKCPSSTCFDDHLNYCTTPACPPVSSAPPALEGRGRGAYPLRYNCKKRTFDCKNKVGLFAHPDDHSVYMKCVKENGKFKAICYTCNKVKQTCFSNSFQACIARVDMRRPCGTGDRSENLQVTKDGFPIQKAGTYYMCNGYDRFPCDALGHGKFENPGDKTVYWECTSKGAKCHVCKKEDNACFIERKNKCVPKCGRDFHQAYDCTTYKGNENYDCKGKTGIFANPEDTSVFFKCQIHDKTGLVKAECFTCSKNKQTCFSNKNQACLTYLGNKCPNEEIIDGPNENGAVGKPDDSLTFDCAGYNKLSVPCASFEKEGRYEHPGDKSVYFECVKEGNSYIAKCKACKKSKNQCFMKEVRKCVNNCQIPKPKPYDCSTYPENHFKCGESGYFSSPDDTSVYFGCWEKDGGKSLCYTCNSIVKTCFDDSEKRCVSNSGRDKCGTKTELQNNPDKGDGPTSLTYSCQGYSDKSFSCGAFEPGSYAIPGDPSVYVKCVELAAGEVVLDADGEENETPAISKFGSCHVCSSEKRGCFDDDKGKCLDNCGAPEEATTTTDGPQITTEGPQSTTRHPIDGRDHATTESPDVTESGTEEASTPATEMPTTATTPEPIGPSGPVDCPEFISNLSKCDDDLFDDKPHFFNCFGNPAGAWKQGCINCTGSTCRDPSATTLAPETNATATPPPPPNELTTWVNCTSTMKALPRCAGSLFNSTPHYFNCFDNPDGSWKKDCVKCVGNNCTDPKVEPEIIVNGTVNPYDCSGYTDTSYPCFSAGLFPHPKDPTVFFECKITPNSVWASFCYPCNSNSRSCYDKDKKKCVIGCVGVGDGKTPPGSGSGNGTGPTPPGSGNGTTPPASNSTGTYGDNCGGYNNAVQCAYKMMYLFINETLDPLEITSHLHGHPGDRAVYFECVQVDNKWLALCHLCPISTCFSEEKQICVTEGCSEYKPDNGTSLGPYKPYDCRFYHLEAYPCTEEGTYANPVDTSVYFECRKNGANLESLCYSCNQNQKTCFVQNRGACYPSKDSKECGPSKNSSTLPKPSMSYDCSGYDPSPEASIPTDQLGKGLFGVPGDYSVFWIIKKDKKLQGECHVCSKDKMACFDPEKMECVDNCQRTSSKPYDCKPYSDPASFDCPYEGYVALDFDSSVFFKCTKSGKKYFAECYSCNSQYKTCFSNSLQVCVTKGGKPCGTNDPSLPPLGGTEEASRTYDCAGLDVSRFPCWIYKEGPHPFKGDKSVYISCMTVNGRYVPVCTPCSKETRSCYDEKVKDCVENCGKGPHQPYNCSTYDDFSFSCTKLGYFANPKDTSIYFQCVSNGKGGFKSLCHSCNSKVMTCFDETSTACVKSGNKCGTISEIPTGVKPELTYECTGYNDLSFPCTALGVGKHANPADLSVFFNCLIKGGKFVAQCESCLKAEKGCYVQAEKKCIENCGRGPPQPYDCSEPYDFKCEREGIFADVKDTSTFFRCNQTSSGLREECFTCNKNLKTCFSNKLQACLTYGGRDCDTSDPVDTEGSGSVAGSRPYSCKGYGALAFPCGKHSNGGKYGSPGDASVYFECDDKTAICTSCVPDEDACFIPEKGKCIDNCGKGPNKPYSCGTYDESSFSCGKEGYFAHPKDNSVFFKCVQVEDKWESWCYSCNANKMTCFSNSEQACVTNNGNACGGKDPVVENQDGGTEETSRSYDCGGFNAQSFPCKKHEVGETYLHPGDKSVYFQCGKNGEAKCKSCKKEDHGCYSVAAKKCIENCYKGQHHPYDCGKYAVDAYPCTKEGGFFSNPEDSAVYFGCSRKEGILMTFCYACNRKRMTCYSNSLQSCLTVGAKSTHADGCGAQGDPKLIQDAGNEFTSRTYDCEGYFTTSFPCHRIKKEGLFGLPGDKSVYMECVKRKDGVWVAKCHVCPRATDSCFVEKRQECVERCGLGPHMPTRPPGQRPSTKKPHKDKSYVVPHDWDIPDFEL